MNGKIPLKILPKLTQEEMETLKRSHFYLSNWIYDYRGYRGQDSDYFLWEGRRG